MDRFLGELREAGAATSDFCTSSIRRSLSRTLCGGGGTWGRREVEKEKCIFGDQRSFCVGQGNSAWLEARQKTTLQQDAAEFLWDIRTQHDFFSQPFGSPITLAQNSYVFDYLMTDLADELAYVQLEGVEDSARKKKFWAVCLGITG